MKNRDCDAVTLVEEIAKKINEWATNIFDTQKVEAVIEAGSFYTLFALARGAEDELQSIDRWLDRATEQLSSASLKPYTRVLINLSGNKATMLRWTLPPDA